MEGQRQGILAVHALCLSRWAPNAGSELQVTVLLEAPKGAFSVYFFSDFNYSLASPHVLF